MTPTKTPAPVKKDNSGANDKEKASVDLAAVKFAKVIKSFHGCEDGELTPRQIEKDEVISGDLAKVAVAQEWAEPCEKPAKKEANGE